MRSSSVWRSERSTVLAVLVLLWVGGGDDRVTGANEVCEDGYESRISLLSVALATRGKWRVALPLRDARGACSPWGEEGPLCDAKGEGAADKPDESVCGGGGFAQKASNTAADAEAHLVPPRRGDDVSEAQQIESVSGWGAVEAQQVGSGAGGGALDALHEHLENDTTQQPAAPAAASRSSLDQLPGARDVSFAFLSPMAVVFHLATAVGYIVHYCTFHMLALLLPSSLRGSDRAVGMAVLMSMMISWPVKFMLLKFSADLFGSGEHVTPPRFAAVSLVTVFSSPLLTAIWDNFRMGSFAALMSGTVSVHAYRHVMWKLLLERDTLRASLQKPILISL